MNKYLINSLNEIAKKLNESSGESKYPIDALNKIAKALDNTNKDFKYPADALAEIANDLVSGGSSGDAEELIKEVVISFMTEMTGTEVPEEVKQMSALEILGMINHPKGLPSGFPTPSLADELLDFLFNVMDMGGGEEPVPVETTPEYPIVECTWDDEGNHYAFVADSGQRGSVNYKSFLDIQSNGSTTRAQLFRFMANSKTFYYCPTSSMSTTYNNVMCTEGYFVTFDSNDKPIAFDYAPAQFKIVSKMNTTVGSSRPFVTNLAIHLDATIKPGDGDENVMSGIRVTTTDIMAMVKAGIGLGEVSGVRVDRLAGLASNVQADIFTDTTAGATIADGDIIGTFIPTGFIHSV